MASWQAHVLSTVLRWTFKRKLTRARTVAEIRQVMAGGRYQMPADVQIVPGRLGQTAGEWVTSSLTASPVALLYLHGGGYVACSPASHRPATVWFARNGFRVWVPDYRLAPEYPFPAAIEDAVAAFRALAEVDNPVVIAGDSAGGGLALAAMLSLRDSGDRLPAAAALFSPLTDLTNRVASRRENDRKCAMFHGAGIGEVVRYYLEPAGVDPATPLASPLFADLRGLPPMLIHVGADEVLRDDSTQLAERARAAGVRVELEVWPVVPHVWQLLHTVIPEGRASLRKAASFLGSVIGPRINTDERGFMPS
jgi:acetyl esterase/lipase